MHLPTFSVLTVCSPAGSSPARHTSSSTISILMDLHCEGNELSRWWSRNVMGVTWREGKPSECFSVWWRHLRCCPERAGRQLAQTKKQKKIWPLFPWARTRVFTGRWKKKTPPSEPVQLGWSDERVVWWEYLFDQITECFNSCDTVIFLFFIFAGLSQKGLKRFSTLIGPRKSPFFFLAPCHNFNLYVDFPTSMPLVRC